MLIAVAIAYGMYVGAVRINLAKFFTYTGAFLIVVAAGILAYGIGALQTVGWLPGLAHKAFDISSWFNWSSWYGEVIQGVFNVTPTPTVLQFAAWLAYLVIVLALFLRPMRKPAKPNARPDPRLTFIELRFDPRIGACHHIRKVHYVNVSPLTAKAGVAAAAALLAGISLTSCTPKESAPSSSDSGGSGVATARLRRSR